MKRLLVGIATVAVGAIGSVDVCTRPDPWGGNAVMTTEEETAASRVKAPDEEVVVDRHSSPVTAAQATAPASAWADTEEHAAAASQADAPPAPKALAPAPAANSHSSTAVPSHAAAQGGWSVQLGLFANRDNAERLMRSAQAKGFAVRVSNADAKGRYRVYASGMADRVAAEAYAQRLKEQGLSAAVVTAP